MKDKEYLCENCGEKITREEFVNQGFTSFCKICLKLGKKEKLKRAKAIFEIRKNRNFIGIDLDEHYFKIGTERIMNKE